MPKVSVIIPTHSRPHLLPGAVESARAAGSDVEILVVDDASTDTTADVCRSMDGIHYIRLAHNLGVAEARNVGILASSADYIAFLDDDDLRLPGTLDRQLQALSARPDAGLVAGPVLFADQKGVLTGEVSSPPSGQEDIFWELLGCDFPIFPASVILRKSCLLRVGLLNGNLSGYDDWDLFVRIAELFPITTVREPVAIYRVATPFSAQGMSNTAALLHGIARHQLELLRLPRAMETSADKRAEARLKALRRICDVLLAQAYRWFPKGAYRYACANLITALRLNPSQVARTMRPANIKKLAARWLRPALKQQS